MYDVLYVYIGLWHVIRIYYVHAREFEFNKSERCHQQQLYHPHSRVVVGVVINMNRPAKC